jgi:hypothetical protein
VTLVAKHVGVKTELMDQLNSLGITSRKSSLGIEAVRSRMEERYPSIRLVLESSEYPKLAHCSSGAW